MIKNHQFNHGCFQPNWIASNYLINNTFDIDVHVNVDVDSNLVKGDALMKYLGFWSEGPFCIALIQSKSQYNRNEVIIRQYVMFEHPLLTKFWIS